MTSIGNLSGYDEPQPKHKCPKCGGEFGNLPVHMKQCQGDRNE